MANTTTVEKLRKLIAHEKSARSLGNQAEAEAFAGRIAEMLTKHRLERSDVELQAETAEPIDQTRVSAAEVTGKQNSGAINWQVLIARGVCATTGCGLMWGTHDGCAIFVGRMGERETARTLYLHMVELAQTAAWSEGQKEKARIVRQMVATYGQGCFGRQSQAMKEFRASYIEGFAQAVSKRMGETAQKELDAAPQASTAMVHIRTGEAAIKHYIGEQAKGRPAKVKMQFGRQDYSAFDRGHQRGSQVALVSHSLRGGR